MVAYLYGTTFKHLPYCFGFNAPPPSTPRPQKKSDLDFRYFVKILYTRELKIRIINLFQNVQYWL